MTKGPGDLLGDSQIMNGTYRVPHADGGEEFLYTLPDGHEVRSGPLPPKLDAGVMQTWFSAIREAVNAAAEEQQASKKREGLDSPAPEPAPVARDKPKPPSPADYVKEQVQAAEARLEAAAEALDGAEAEHNEALADLREWTAVFDALNLGEENETD